MANAKVISEKRYGSACKGNNTNVRVLSEQRYSSACTSVNSCKVPAIFKKIDFKSNTINLDYGGGKYETATEYLATKGVKNYVYDIYNRTLQHNAAVIKATVPNKADTVTCANVLNVIMEAAIRDEVVSNCKKALKPKGTAYFYIYEGDRTGFLKVNENRNSCQLNAKAEAYMPLIKKYFSNVVRKGQLIIAKNF